MRCLVRPRILIHTPFCGALGRFPFSTCWWTPDHEVASRPLFGVFALPEKYGEIGLSWKRLQGHYFYVPPGSGSHCCVCLVQQHRTISLLWEMTSGTCSYSVQLVGSSVDTHSCVLLRRLGQLRFQRATRPGAHSSVHGGSWKISMHFLREGARTASWRSAMIGWRRRIF